MVSPSPGRRSVGTQKHPPERRGLQRAHYTAGAGPPEQNAYRILRRGAGEGTAARTALPPSGHTGDRGDMRPPGRRAEPGRQTVSQCVVPDTIGFSGYPLSPRGARPPPCDSPSASARAGAREPLAGSSGRRRASLLGSDAAFYSLVRARRRHTTARVTNSHIIAAAENTAGPRRSAPLRVVTSVPALSRRSAPTVSHKSQRSTTLPRDMLGVYCVLGTAACAHW